MTCVTHHHACDCREEKVREMCEYLLFYCESALNARFDWNALQGAVEIANELYPLPGRNEGHIPPKRSP